MSAPARPARRPAARQRPQPDAGICGGEVSAWRCSTILRDKLLAYRDLWNVWPKSFRFDVGCLDHLAPLHGFVGDELCKVSGRSGKRGHAQIGKSRDCSIVRKSTV